MSEQLNRQLAEGNFTPSCGPSKRQAARAAVSDLAVGMRDEMKTRIMVTGRKADAYVRDHPGRIIVGACAIGLAAGWLFGRTVGKRGNSDD
jgi:ElaB/YqjD/DUF883 family membrane-anchored ribosome-binding protein